MVSKIPQILEEAYKYLVWLIVSAKNVQVKGKHISDKNESAVTRITDDNITEKMFVEKYVEESYAKINLYPHDIH
ncbi:hypothetical protein HZS_7944 [Henneguya salminicola]|nr:hypothetical protein HZS_7944 [Henneguya salminicola]